MADTPEDTTPAHPKPGWRDGLKQTFAEGMETIDRSEPVASTTRQQIAGALILGVCVVFLAALLGVPHLDTSLQIAVIAFFMGIPILTLDFMLMSFKFGRGPTHDADLLTEGLQVGAWIIGDGIGFIAVLAGVAAIVWHLYTPAFWIGVATFGLASVAVIVVAVVYAAMTMKSRGESKSRSGDATPGPAS